MAEQGLEVVVVVGVVVVVVLEENWNKKDTYKYNQKSWISEGT